MMTQKKQTAIVPQNMLFLLVVVIITLLGDFFEVWDRPQQFAEPYLWQLQSPVTKFWGLTIDWGSRLREYWTATKQLTALKQQYSQTVTELRELESLRLENRELRRILENTDRKLMKTFFTAPVVSFAQPTVLVGSFDGMQSGTVVSSHGTLLGFLGKTNQHSSQVDLLTQSDLRPTLASTDHGVQGLIKGDGRYLWLTEVPSDAVVLKGEQVFTVGQEGIPKGLLIGVVVQVDEAPQDAVLKIQVKQLVSFFTTDIVEVY